MSRKASESVGRIVAGVVVSSLSFTAAAQPPAAPASPAEDSAGPATELEEVVVTAQRREEKLQDVPVAVTAFTRDQIEARGIESLDDLNSLAPGLQISRTPSNTTISQITIRGSSQINPAIYWDPSVGVYLDGVYIGKAQGSIFDVVDLARVEVLRGPQGTLYGRNTIGGTINLWSREPSGVFGGTAGIEVGEDNRLQGKASVDLPAFGIASISLGARAEVRDGWVETEPGSSVDELNDLDNRAFRLAARFDFSPSVEGYYAFDFSDVDQANNFDQLYRVNEAALPFLAPFASRERQERAAVDAPSFERSRVSGHSFTLTWNASEHHTVKSITGYRDLEWADSLDLDGSPLDIAFTQRFTDYDQLSQDLQLLGRFDRLNYVAGFYYFGDDGQTNNPQAFFGAFAPGGDVYFDSRYGTETSAWAAYTQADWQVLDPLTLSAGIRYTREKKELDRVFGVRQDPADPFFYLIPEGTHASETFDDTNLLLAAEWQLEPGINVYARYAEGFKSGGFNGEFSDPAAPPDVNIAETQTPFEPEEQKSIELGLKSTFWENRGQVNIAVFHNDLQNLQASIFLGTGAAATAVRNAGEATVNGIELETAFVLSPGTQLRFNYAYLDAEYDRFIDAGTNQAGNRAFVHAPENALNIVFDSEFLRRDWGALRGVIDYAYTDEFYTYPYQLSGPGEAGFNPAAQVAADSQVESYGMLNLRLAATGIPLGSSASGELALFVRNATDEDVANNFIDFGPGFGSLTVANFVEPRAWGVAGIVRW